MEYSDTALVAEVTGREEISSAQLRIEVARRNPVIAIKLHIVEGCCDAIPSGHGGGFHAPHVRHRNDHHTAASHRTAHKNDLQFNRGSGSQFLGAEEIAAS